MKIVSILLLIALVAAASVAGAQLPRPKVNINNNKLILINSFIYYVPVCSKTRTLMTQLSAPCFASPESVFCIHICRIVTVSTDVQTDV